MASVGAGYVFGSTETVTAAKLSTLLTSATVGSIVNADIDSSAAIANSKLNLASISQAISLAGGLTLTTTGLTLTSVIAKLAKGADVASAAGNIALGDDGNYFDITGTSAITSITAKTAGTVVTLQFDSTASLVDGSNLKINGNFQGAAEAQITLVSDGTNWFEVSRNTGGGLAAATQAEMETATSTTVAVTPGRTQYHPGVAKAWCNFNGSGTPAMTVSHNMDSSITDNGTGDFTLSFTTDFSSGNYVMAGSGLATGLNEPITVTIKQGTSPAAGSINILVGIGTFTAKDPTIVNLIFFGDQS